MVSISIARPAFRLGLGVSALGAGLALPNLSWAQDPAPQHFTLDGVAFELRETDDFDKVLRANGQELDRDGLFVIEDAPQDVAGHSVLLGAAGTGGSVCGADVLVIWVDQGQPKLDRYGDPCSHFEVEHAGDHLIYREAALPDVPGKVLEWRPGRGFEESYPLYYGPIETMGWEDLAALESNHPVEALRAASLYGQLEEGLGAEGFAKFGAQLIDLGSGRYLEGQGYAGHACLKWECEDAFAWLWTDTALEQAYVIFKAAEDEEPTLWPLPLESWPKWVVLDAAETFAK